MERMLRTIAVTRFAPKIIFACVLLCLAAPFFASAQSCVAPPSGLVSWWQGENNALDQTGGNGGSWSYSPAYATGKVGQAFNISGGNFVRVTDAPNLHFTNAMTAEAWINPSSYNGGAIMVKYATAPAKIGCCFSFSIDGSGHPLLLINTNASSTSSVMVVASNAVPLNQWSHVAATYDGAVLKVYLNGVLNGSLAVVSSIYPGSADLGIGACCGDEPNSYATGLYSGLIDEPSLYNRALSASEIAGIYNAGAAGKCAPLVAPAITSQPQPQTVYAGRSVSFTVSATGTSPLAYQWALNGTPLAGATNTVLNLTNVQSANGGNYTVKVSNVVSSVTSSNALLTVTPLPPCTAPPSGVVGWWSAEGNTLDQVGGNTGSWYGTPIYGSGEVGQAFQFNGSGFVHVPDAPNLRFTNGMTAEAWINPSAYGSFGSPTSILVKYGAVQGATGSVFSFSLGNSGQPYLQINTNSSLNSSAQVNASNSAPLNQWTHVAGTYDGTTLRIYVNGVLNGSVAVGASIYAGDADLGIGACCGGAANGQQTAVFRGLIDEPSLYNRALSASEIAGIYNAGPSGKCGGMIAPVITSQPQSQTVPWGTNVNFTVTSGGSAPFTYQWSFNGNPVAGATNSGLALTNVQGSASGNYSVVVSNNAGYATSSNAALTVQPAVIPNLTAQPQSQAVLVGTNVTFNVSSTGTAPLSYQWQFNNAPIFGATNTTLTLVNVQTNNSGNYSVLVSNLAGTTASSNALLTVIVPVAPTITTQPQSQTVPADTNVLFTVTASGTAPLSYQWQFNGAPVSGATTSALSLTDVRTFNNGNYSVVVSNTTGSATSSNALLTVVMPPCAAPPSGIVSWWSGESNTLDSIGGNNATWSAGPAYGIGKVGYAFLTGGNNFVRVPDAPNLRFTTGLTAEAWINPSSIGISSILVKWNNNQCAYSFSLDGAGRPYLLISTDGVSLSYNVVASNAVPVNQWTHIAGTYDGSTLNLYVNGALVSSVAAAGSIFPGTDDLGIGANVGGGQQLAIFRGLIDEPSLYSRALNASEIMAIYNASASGKCPSSVPPSITYQPQPQTVGAGSNVTFTVAATGSIPLSYQWSKNNSLIPSATNSSLTVSNVQMADNGSVFSVVVSNQAGIATSSNATLTVLPPPSLFLIPNLTATSGVVTVPVILVAQGDENTVGFSIDFNSSALTFAGAALDPGTNASLLVNSNQLASGRVGLGIALASDASFGAGTNVVAYLTFNVVPNTNTVVTQLTFDNLPIGQQCYDAVGDTLASVYTNGVVTIPFLGLEGDVFPLSNGDAAVRLNDWLQMGRFVAGLDVITNALEFQRADCAPRSTLGDGYLTVSDWVQAGRYAAGLDPLTVAGGPTQNAGGGSPSSLKIPQTTIHSLSSVSGRTLSIANGSVQAGLNCQVSVQFLAQGNENALEFSLSFSPSAFSYVSAALGSNATGATLILNTNKVSSGSLGVVLAMPIGSTFAASNLEVLKLNLKVAAVASGNSPIAFITTPLTKEVSDATANTLPSTYVPGTLSIAPLSRPNLATAVRSVGSSSFSWSSSVGGFLLESTTTLQPPHWTNAVATLTTNGSTITVAAPTNHGAIYYRLRHP